MAELRTYKRKRDFGETPEPSGDGKREEAPGGRFVVQEHHARRIHWDLRLERDGVLASWAIPNGIPMDPGENRKAVRTEDHPLEYLDFRGEIPEGQYGAGTMTIWDQGTYDVHTWTDKKVTVDFHGERLRGRYALFRTGEGSDWMIHRMDPPEPGREPMPEHVVPMCARLGQLPPDDDRWAYEIKWDGVRAIAYLRPGRLTLESRNLNDITAQYPELRGLTRAAGARELVLDGEIVAFDSEGRPSFERLQQRMHQTSESVIRRRMTSHPVTYVIFDVLYADGRSLMGEPYRERRRLLGELQLSGDHWQTPEYNVGGGAALLAATAEQGLEGLVAKRLESRYEPGKRGGSWLKVKNTLRQEFVIGGWLPGEGRRRDSLGALLVGYYDDGELRYAGRVGTGFSEKDLVSLLARLRTLERKTSPFKGKQPPKGAFFVKPELVAEVEFSEWTKERMLRHPSFKGLRDDKQSRDVVLETEEPALLSATARPLPGGRAEVDIGGRTLRLSNLDKVLYPKAGFTKGELIDYYARISDFLLPHLHDRPLTLKRYPEGVEGQHFYEKRCPTHRPDWVATAAISSERHGEIDYCVVNDLPTLAWVANLASIELHVSLSEARHMQRPTAMVFDLDPGAPADIVDCCQVAVWVRGMLDQMRLHSFPKTSGSKGLQLYVPLNHPKMTYEQSKPFAKAVAETLEEQFPDRVVSKMAKDIRPGKVFVDWSQNDDYKTTVCVYSVRAKERPTVSTPVTWEEVEDTLKAGDASRLVFDHAQVIERLAEHGDLFAPVLSEEQELPPL